MKPPKNTILLPQDLSEEKSALIALLLPFLILLASFVPPALGIVLGVLSIILAWDLLKIETARRKKNTREQSSEPAVSQ